MREAGWYDRNGQRKPELPAQAGAPPRPVQTCVRPPPSVLDVPVTVWMRTDEPDVFVELVEVDQIRLERARVKGGVRFQRLRRRLRAERRRKERDYEPSKWVLGGSAETQQTASVPKWREHKSVWINRKLLHLLRKLRYTYGVIWYS